MKEKYRDGLVNLKIRCKKKEFNVMVKRANIFQRLFGLMFKSNKTDNLLFDFQKETNLSLHSLFVFFPFLVLWLNKDNEIIKSRLCKPFELKISTNKLFCKIVELPFNNDNKQIICFFVGKERFKY